MLRIVFILSALLVTAKARPISYAGGWTFMSMNNWESSIAHYHYSPTAFESFGISLENYNESNRYDTNFQFNKLIKRKNTRTSQANLYLKTKAGLAFEGNNEYFNSHLGLAADWETRRYFTSYETALHYSDDLDNGSFHQQARVGIAPYIAEFGDLHTWLMLQVEHHPEEEQDSQQFIVTPLVRLFKGAYLTEFGINSNGNAIINLIIRF